MCLMCLCVYIFSVDLVHVLYMHFSTYACMYEWKDTYIYNVSYQSGLHEL
jgi:hypothetical protein